MTIVWHT